MGIEDEGKARAAVIMSNGDLSRAVDHALEVRIRVRVRVRDHALEVRVIDHALEVRVIDHALVEKALHQVHIASINNLNL